MRLSPRIAHETEHEDETEWLVFTSRRTGVLAVMPREGRARVVWTIRGEDFVNAWVERDRPAGGLVVCGLSPTSPHLVEYHAVALVGGSALGGGDDSHARAETVLNCFKKYCRRGGRAIDDVM